MRTTLNLPDGLVEAAKQRARERGMTLTDFIRDAMGRMLDQTPSRQPAPMPTFGGPSGKGLRVDILDRDALWVMLDDRDDSNA